MSDKVGIHALELGVLGFQLLDALELGNANSAILAFPVVVSGLTDAVLAADIGLLQTGINLLENRDDLAFGEFALLERPPEGLAGFQRSLMSPSVKHLSEDDLSVLVLRGCAVVDEYARKSDYNNPESFSRFGIRLGATLILSAIKEKGGDIKNMEPFLVMYANILPPASEEAEYRAYNELLKNFKK